MSMQHNNAPAGDLTEPDEMTFEEACGEGLIEELTIYKCRDCDALSEETTGEPLYECNSCGRRFNRANSQSYNHQCPDCQKFAGKVASDSCSECEEGEVEEVEGFKCTACDELFEEQPEIEAHLLKEHGTRIVDEE